MLVSSSLLVVLLAQAPIASASEMIDKPFEMPKSLFEAASDARGYRYCDQRLKQSQARKFDKRYGERVKALAAVIRDKEGLGWGPEDMLIMTCRGGVTEQDRARALREFEKRLSALEARYQSVAKP